MSDNAVDISSFHNFANATSIEPGHLSHLYRVDQTAKIKKILYTEQLCRLKYLCPSCIWLLYFYGQFSFSFLKIKSLTMKSMDTSKYNAAGSLF
jgi:hypothetical protein